MREPLVTVAVPSYNHGQFLDDALRSIFEQDLPVEVFLMDGGSSDNTRDVIEKWKDRLSGWRSHRDEGQAAAINEGIALGSAPYVCWINSDDFLLANGLSKLVTALESAPAAPAAYGRAWNIVQETGRTYPVWVEEFSQQRLALRCIVSQPATLIRRSAWEAVGGVDVSLHMVMDYDLWWRLFKQHGALHFLDDFVAVNREHAETKTKTLRRRHYREAMAIVRQHNGSIPLKWWIAQPYSVWYKSLIN
ncbi:glycosyltransferase [Rhizobium sp. VS19-DR104.2]|uniref:glycosyltransferase family 2 protein n=1 Tax=unclassified Rhizobium TaxID=2613769 RepID=UPI001CC45ABB|nr:MULTISPECIES: glycosyltransferase family 2 protein [unclassified Rhizobium]MBZ5761976.1 glycosyltransferase [Rhizobium sp. VS19-DR96]MBZ5768378.1 glycosyltransferase [Rhizobium sp. VS19-DR129.2]MBZ5775648.1 glycosyltransferase [Rhizobium sp. VS19-DRK62.2]MBZ5786854.1 glycosyltransferase [Rhizobium sp. VS19-DR121]MBZ5804424.1 glycosyltransferase [Rhizobium sp. VS19-DR181]